MTIKDVFIWLFMTALAVVIFLFNGISMNLAAILLCLIFAPMALIVSAVLSVITILTSDFFFTCILNCG